MRALGPFPPLFLTDLEALIVTHQNFVRPAVTITETLLFSVPSTFPLVVLHVHSCRINGYSSILRIIYDYLNISQLLFYSKNYELMI